MSESEQKMIEKRERGNITTYESNLDLHIPEMQRSGPQGPFEHAT